MGRQNLARKLKSGGEAWACRQLPLPHGRLCRGRLAGDLMGRCKNKRGRSAAVKRQRTSDRRGERFALAERFYFFKVEVL